MFIAIRIKIPMTFFTDIEKSILKFKCKHQRPQIDNATLRKCPMLAVSQSLTSKYTA
jgi:hypothetical protein